MVIADEICRDRLVSPFQTQGGSHGRFEVNVVHLRAYGEKKSSNSPYAALCDFRLFQGWRGRLENQGSDNA